MICERKSKSLKVAEQYRIDLLNRKLKADSRIEAVDELAVRYGISHRTARKVQQILAGEDILYSKRGSGTFVKHDPPKTLKIGCTWNEPDPFKNDEVALRHTRLVKRAFREADLDFHPVAYDSLLEPAKVETELKQLDGLLLSSGYVDDRTLPLFRNLKKPVVLVRKEALEDQLLVHQVMTDWEQILTDLIPDVKPFRRLLILSAGHGNVRYMESLIRKVYPEHDIQTVIFSYPDLSRESYRYFLRHRTGYENTLIFSSSNLFSESLRSAFGTHPLPALIELDNLEKYLPNAKSNSVFTAIDHEYEQIYAKALDLLKKQIFHNDGCRYIIRVRPRLIIRKSFVPKHYKYQEAYHE